MKLALLSLITLLSFSCGNIDNTNPTGAGNGTGTFKTEGYKSIQAMSVGSGIVNYTFSLVVIEDTSPIKSFYLSNTSFENLNQIIRDQSVIRYGRLTQTEIEGMSDLKSYLNATTETAETLLSKYNNKNYLYLGRNTSMHGLTTDTKLVLTLENGNKKTIYL